jgi:hypothetical protein
MRMNVYEPDVKIIWAEVNNGGMTETRGTKMMKWFIAYGIESTPIEWMIHVAMSPDWISGLMLDSWEGLKIMELPVLMLTTEGIEAANAKMIELLEGMGCRGGILRYCALVEKQITALKSKIDQLKGNPSDVTRLSLTNTKAELEIHLEASSWWTFRILAKGEQGQ